MLTKVLRSTTLSQAALGSIVLASEGSEWTCPGLNASHYCHGATYADAHGQLLTISPKRTNGRLIAQRSKPTKIPTKGPYQRFESRKLSRLESHPNFMAEDFMQHRNSPCKRPKPRRMDQK